MDKLYALSLDYMWYTYDRLSVGAARDGGRATGAGAHGAALADLLVRPRAASFGVSLQALKKIVSTRSIGRWFSQLFDTTFYG